MPRFSDPLADSLDDPLAWENIPPALNPHPDPHPRVPRRYRGAILARHLPWSCRPPASRPAGNRGPAFRLRYPRCRRQPPSPRPDKHASPSSRNSSTFQKVSASHDTLPISISAKPMAFFNQILNDRGFIGPIGDMLAIYHQCAPLRSMPPSASPTKVTSASQASLPLMFRTKSRKLRAASSLTPQRGGLALLSQATSFPKFNGELRAIPC